MNIKTEAVLENCGDFNMSCISSNFSSFFLDSLNDPSEFAKYLGNAENKAQSIEEQVFGTTNSYGYYNGNPSGTSSGSQPTTSSTGNINSSSSTSGSVTTSLSNGATGPTEVNGSIIGSDGDVTVYNSSPSESHLPLSQQHNPPSVQQQQHQTPVVHHPVNPNHQPQHILHQHQNHNQPMQHISHPQQPPPAQPQPQAAGGNLGPLPSSGNYVHQQSLLHHHRPLATAHPHHQQHQLNHNHQQATPAPSLPPPHHPPQVHHALHQQQPQPPQPHLHHNPAPLHHTLHQQQQQHPHQVQVPVQVPPQHYNEAPRPFETSFGGFTKYSANTPPGNLIDLDNASSALSTTSANRPGSTSNNNNNNTNNQHNNNLPIASAAVASAPSSSTTPIEVDAFDHDSKNLFDVHNSNESTGTSCGGELRTSSNASECSDSSNQANASKPLIKFIIKESYEVHPAHKVEEGIFQHMNKLPVKKKDTLKQLGVTFTGHMSINEKSIIVDNFARFCEEYGISDHRPFLSLNQSGMPKPEQIKFARFLGQGLPNFTLFCIYSNFKNLFCTKRFENYSKGTYNLHYILDKTKRFLQSTTSELKNLTSQNCDSNDTPINNNGKQDHPRILERLQIFENFDVHESHRIEDGIFTHIGRLSPKKQELLKQFGIQNNHNVSLYEKHIIIENFMKFCNEYYINDHRPFLDFHDSGLPKMEQIKFARYLGQGVPNLTLYKIYSAFKDVLALNRIEKLIVDGYHMGTILKKKKKNLLNRMSAAAAKEMAEAAKQANVDNSTS